MTAPQADCDKQDMVVVVHGFAGKRLWMFPMGWRLRKRGFRVASWGYLSVLGCVDSHANRLRSYLMGPLANEPKVHIVAHSMGAIVVWAALAKGPIGNLRRVVFIAPPSAGSPVARVASAVFGRICKPLRELSDGDSAYVTTLPAMHDIEIGVVAARFDLLVPAANTHITGEREHVVLNATHNSLLIYSASADLASAFFNTGRFHDAA